MTAEQQHKGVLTYLYNELNNFRGKFYFRMGQMEEKMDLLEEKVKDNADENDIQWEKLVDRVEVCEGNMLTPEKLQLFKEEITAELSKQFVSTAALEDLKQSLQATDSAKKSIDKSESIRLSKESEANALRLQERREVIEKNKERLSLAEGQIEQLRVELSKKGESLVVSNPNITFGIKEKEEADTVIVRESVSVEDVERSNQEMNQELASQKEDLDSQFKKVFGLIEEITGNFVKRFD